MANDGADNANDSYYRRNIRRLMSEYGISTEAEIVTGHIIKLKKQRRGTLQREHVEIAEIINSRLKAIKAKVKDMFFRTVDDQSSENQVGLSRLASALYHVTYNEATEEETSCLSLPWIFVDYLLSARKLTTNSDTVPAALPTPSRRQPRSVLQQLSEEVNEYKEIDQKLRGSRLQRIRAFQRLSNVMSQVNSVHVTVSLFGSHATGFDDTASSLDIYIDVKPHKMSQKVFDQIMSSVRREYSLPRQRPTKLGLKPIVLFDDVNHVRVCLYTSVTCTRRTVYIISAFVNNPWIVPVLQTLISWSKENKITGSDRSSTMTTEQLVLLFLSYCSQDVVDHCPVDADRKSTVMDLVVRNHFANCRASTCCHATKPKQSTESTDKSTKRQHHNDEKFADVIVNFLNHSSRLQGEVLKEVVDPAFEDGKTKLFNLKETQYHRLAERMLKAYHTLARSGHFLDLVEKSTVSDRLLMDLPQEVCKRILFTEKSYAEKLKRESKAEMVAIRRRPYKDSLFGLVLEAWGSWQSLQLIYDVISDEAKAKPSMFAAGANQLALENAYVTVFKNSDSESSSITLINYSGPCQSNHDQFVRHIPRLLQPHPESSFSRNKFVERSLQQVEMINAQYDGDRHGNIRAVVSYGTFYVANCSTHNVISETDFDGLFSKVPKAEAANPDLVHPGAAARGRGRRPRRGRRGRSFVVQQPYTRCRNAFIPAGNRNIDTGPIQAFLRNNRFVLAEEIVDYRITLKLSVSGQQLKLEAVVVLDEDFNLKYVNMPDIKWLCVNVVSGDKNADYRPYDCRFKIQSRAKRSALQLRQESDDFADIIANHQRMLLRTGNGVYGVHQDFLSRIRYMRKKHTKVYKLAANQHAATTDAFLYGTAIKINHGTEYSRPSPSGAFQNVDENRFEITAIPELPDLHDEDKTRTFFNKIWEFAEELGSTLE